MAINNHREPDRLTDEKMLHRIHEALKEWGRWRRNELADVAPRNPLRGASWQRQIRDEKEWAELAHEIDREPDESLCIHVQAAYERLKAQDTGFEVVIRDYYVDGLGWPPKPLLNHALYLMWKHGA